MLKRIGSGNPPATQMRIRATATLVIMTAILLAVSLPGLARRKPAEGKESGAHAQAAMRTEAASPENMESLRQQFGRLPLAFEVNEGQTDSSVAFLSRGSGYTVWLTRSEAVFGFRVGGTPKSGEPRDGRPSSGGDGREQKQAALRLSLLGANPAAAISGEDELAHKSNYLIGSDRSRWKQGIASFRRVRYSAVYPGVDLVYYGNQQQLEYDFALAPHADASQIRLRVRGQGHVQISAGGDLEISTAAGPVVFRKPVAYQEASDTHRQLVPAEYILSQSGEMSFRLGEYDHSRSLVIDPSLAYSTFLGGSGGFGDVGLGIAVDSAGNAYVTGQTASPDFPTTAGAFQTTINVQGDTFVSKLNSTGSALLYSTFVGGDSLDVANAIAIDNNGNAYVGGETFSTTFPTTAGALQTTKHAGAEAFIFKLNPAGSALVYSTYLGGSSDDLVQAIKVDTAGNAYVTGVTVSSDFPTTAGAFARVHPDPGSQTGFVSKLNPAGSALVYSTYLGGSSATFINTLGLDASGNAYLGGTTGGSSYPTTPGSFQPTDPFPQAFSRGFVTKLNASGSGLVFSTFLASAPIANVAQGFTEVRGLALDSAGNVYLTGDTPSTGFPTTAGSFQPVLALHTSSNAFLTKLNPSGSGLVYSTYLGGTTGETGVGVAVDGANEAAVVLTTGSSDFPLTLNALTNFCPVVGTGESVVALTRFSSDGASLVYSTCIGVARGTLGVIALDSAGNVYLTGSTGDHTYPTTPGSLQPTTTATDITAFITKFNLPATLPPVSLTATTLDFGSDTVGTTSPAQSVTLTNNTAVVLNITGISITGANNADYQQTNTCGTTVPAGGTCSIDVTFTPGGPGVRVATVQIVDTGTSKSLSRALAFNLRRVFPSCQAASRSPRKLSAQPAPRKASP